MAFTIETFQNAHLAPDQDRVDAILSVTAGGDVSGGGAPTDLLLGFIVDTSGSMGGPRIQSVRKAVVDAIQLLDERVTFFVVRFHNQAQVVSPPARATAANKSLAASRVSQLSSGGGTAMSTGLSTARMLFEQMPNAIRQCIFLTDGKNESEHPQQVQEELGRCASTFECDCWGVGTDWQVGEVQEIARGLMGKASLIPEPAGIQAAFDAAVRKAQSKSIKDARLRLWTPVGTQIVFVKQVNPTIEELTDKAKPVSEQVRDYYTGAWGSGEARDFHIALRVHRGGVGDEMLAARPSMLYQASGPAGWQEQEDKQPTARVFANWTADDTLSSRLDSHVAHYTGQDELARAIQQGLESRERGDEATATQMLGKAVKIAAESGNEEATSRLKKVVDVIDPHSGTVRLKKDATKAAAMDLELESTTTRRAKKGTSV